MFTQPARIMDINDVRYVETIPNTMYRSKGDQIIILRSRGKDNKGAIKGTRYYAFVHMPNGMYRKMRSDKGTIRYFSSPEQAASAAAVVHKEARVMWLKTQDYDALVDLAVKRHLLMREVDKLRTTLETLRADVTKAAGRKTASRRASTLCATTPFADLPVFMRQSAARIVSRYVN